jgi:hypothetical protein
MWLGRVETVQTAETSRVMQMVEAAVPEETAVTEL